MATVVIENDRLTAGSPPHVCVKTGTETDMFISVEMTYLPNWTFLMLFTGIVPSFVAVMFARRTVIARLPVTELALAT